MADYRLTETDIVFRTADNAAIPNDPNNCDRVAYDAWLADGGVPDPAAPVTPPGIDPGTLANQRLDAGVDAAVDSINASLRDVMPPHSNPPTVEELQAQIDYLSAQMQTLNDAVRAMLIAHDETGQIAP
jgi:hypothetical protein